MRDEDRLAALRRLKVETGSLVCLGCGYEHNCGVHGCRILRETITRLEQKLTETEMDHEAAELLSHLCRDCDLDRLEELAEADKDGRVVVLPCKVGDKLYRVFAGEIFEHRVGRMKYFAIQGQWDIETYPFCPCVESSIGKTIFLTREEARKALEAMRKGEMT